MGGGCITFAGSFGKCYMTEQVQPAAPPPLTEAALEALETRMSIYVRKELWISIMVGICLHCTLGYKVHVFNKAGPLVALQMLP